MKKYNYGKKNSISKLKIRKIGGFLLLGIGICSLLYFFFPIFSFSLYLTSALAQNNMESPLPQRFIVKSNNSIINLLSFQLNNVAKNYYDARNWTPDTKRRVMEQSVKEFRLSIPTQGIIDAKVSSSDFDLSKHLVQYFTTSKNPVYNGTSVIYGHSSLPQWFNPTDYTTIFAKLHLLNEGESIIITVDGKSYKYKIFSKSIMDSTDPDIFSQNFDNSYITLVTCTPPGTTWKRLVIKASFEKKV